MVKYFYKVWSGMTKFLVSQCRDKEQCVDFPLVGRFMKSQQSKKFVFIPHLDFLNSGRFSFPQNDSNVSPLSKRVPRDITSVKMSLGSIGVSCEFDRDLVASILKDVMSKFVS